MSKDAFTYERDAPFKMSTSNKAKILAAGVSKVPTNVSKTFTFGPPPADVNLLTADDSTLVKYGIPIRPRGSRKVVRTWERLVGRGFVHLQPQLRQRPERKTNPRQGDAGPEVTSSTWSGGVLLQQGEPFHYIYGQWVVPTVVPGPEDSDGEWWSVAWVGLDGFNGLDVLQAGTAQHVSRSGKTEYFAWYEWFPDSWTEISSFMVLPGDTVAVTISFDGTDDDGLQWGSAYFLNVTRGFSTNVRFNPPAGTVFAGSTAEWIMERPSFGTPSVPAVLPQYGEVVFTDGLACTASATFASSAGFPLNMDPGGDLMSAASLTQDWTCLRTNIAE